VHIPTATQNVFLYLGVATESSEHKLRYDSYSASVRDWHSADFAQIDCVEHKLQLFVAAEPPAGYSCVPLARILSSKLDPDYAAPMLCVDNRTCAYHKVLEFIGFLRSKVDGISRTHPVLPSLVESVIEIEALLKMKGVHPANLYIAMIKLVARSNALCATYMIPPFIPYKHNDVMRTFGYIMHHVRDNLSNVRDVDSVGLEYRQGKFYADIRPEYQFEENMLAIGIEFRDQSNRDITEWIKHAIIEGGGMQASLRRVLGAPRGLVNKINKLGLEERSNFLLAVVGVDGDYLSASDTLCIYNPSDTESQPDNIRIMFAGRAAE
jgi:predicted component of type VI protein secretion system